MSAPINPAPSGPASPPSPATQTALAPDATDERRRLAERVLVDALLLGVVGDALLRVASWGANMTVWSLGILAALITLARRRHDAVPASARLLIPPAVVLSVLFAWRDSAELAAFNALALAVTIGVLGLALGNGPHRDLMSSRVRDVVYGAVTTGIGTVFGMFALLLSDVSLKTVARGRGAS